MSNDKIKEKLSAFAEERTNNYIESYLPSWIRDDWNDEDTNFLRVYLLDCLTDAVEQETFRLKEMSSGLEYSVLKNTEEIHRLTAENARYKAALEEYANGTALRIRPEKAHLYEKDYPMDSPEWLQRSMSDWSHSQLAKETLREAEDT